MSEEKKTLKIDAKKLAGTSYYHIFVTLEAGDISTIMRMSFFTKEPPKLTVTEEKIVEGEA